MLSDSVLGGDAGDHEQGRVVMLSAYGSVQETGLAKRACYGVVVKDDAEVKATHATLVGISEAAVLIASRASAWLRHCVVSPAVAAMMAGQGRGRRLECSQCSFFVERLWADADRPRGLIWGEGNVVTVNDRETDAPVESVIQHPRGAASDDSSSTSSLQEQEFADMERLMEQLDDAELEGGVVETSDPSN